MSEAPVIDGPARRQPVIRIFVSSTFSDLKLERDALQRGVFRPLEEHCASRRFQFQAIDLRWGVPAEASLDHRTMRLCFEELRRAQTTSPRPNFLVLLGNRYGWRPLPELISEGEFGVLESSAATLAELRIVRAWYVRDDNAVPAAYELRSRRTVGADGVDFTRDASWNEVQATLQAVIRRAWPSNLLTRRFDLALEPDGLPPAIVRFRGSATEQEIWRGVFPPGAADHVLAVLRDIEDDSLDPRRPGIEEFIDIEPGGAIDTDAKSALADLRDELVRRLPPEAVVSIGGVRLTEAVDAEGQPQLQASNDHLESLCERLLERLRGIVDEQIDLFWKVPVVPVPAARLLEIELNEHRMFGRERAPDGAFLGRVAEMERIAAYLAGPERDPLVVHGVAGSGKTALLARAALEAARWNPVVRFVGVTPQSSSLRPLLTSICLELRQRAGQAEEPPAEIEALTAELHGRFEAATVDAPLLLILDALDQLGGSDAELMVPFVPMGPLPPHVKLIVSCVSEIAPGEPPSRLLVELRRRGAMLLSLDALSEEDARALFFERWLPDAKRRVTRNQARLIEERLAAPACRLPLYLRMVFETARNWSSGHSPPALGRSVAELLEELFDRMSDAGSHGPAAAFALGYLASARRGLTDNELLELMRRDPDYMRDLLAASTSLHHRLPDEPQRIPIAIWSRLRHDLGLFFAERSAPGGPVLGFYHREVEAVVRRRFLGTPDLRYRFRQRLIDYFRAQPFVIAGAISGALNVRKADELPWSLLEALREHPAELPEDLVDGLVDLLTEGLLLEAKGSAELIEDLARELENAVALVPPVHPGHGALMLLSNALRRDIHFVARYAPVYPQALFQCLWNECSWAPTPLIRDSLGRWREARARLDPGFPWIRLCHPPTRPGFISRTRELSDHDANVLAVAVVPRARRCLSASADATIRIWDLDTASPPKVLRGHHGAVSRLVSSSDGRIALSASGDGTIRVWDLVSLVPLRSIQILERGFVDDVALAEHVPLGVVSCFRGVYLLNLEAPTSSPELLVSTSRKTPVERIAISPVAATVACATRMMSEENQIDLWSVPRRTPIATLRGHHDAICAVRFLDEATLVSASDDGKVIAWDLPTLSRKFEVALEWGVKDLAVSADRRRLYVAARRGVLVLDASKGDTLQKSYLDSMEVSALAVSDAPETIVAAGWDEKFIVCPTGPATPADAASPAGPANPAEVPCGTRNTMWFSSLATSADRRVVALKARKQVVVYDKCGTTEMGHWEDASDDEDNGVAVSGDGRLLAYVSGTPREILVRDTHSGAVRAVCVVVSQGVCLLCLDADGHLLVGATRGGEITIFDVSRGECVATRKIDAAVLALVLSSDGRRCALSLCSDHVWLEVFDTAAHDGQAALFHVETNCVVEALALSADGTRLIARGSRLGQQVTMTWDLTSCELVSELPYGIDPDVVAAQPDPPRYRAVQLGGRVHFVDAVTQTSVAFITNRIRPVVAGPEWNTGFGLDEGSFQDFALEVDDGLLFGSPRVEHDDVYQAALNVRERTLGAVHRVTLAIRIEYAQYLVRSHRPVEAEEILRHSLILILRASPEAPHPELKAVLGAYVECLQHCGLDDEQIEARFRELAFGVLRSTALDLVQRGDHEGAVRRYEHLLQSGFDLASTLCHLARVALARGDIPGAERYVREAWTRREHAPPYVVPRIIWLQLALTLLRRGRKQRIAVLLGRLKTALLAESASEEWVVDPMLDALKPALADRELHMLATLSRVFSEGRSSAELNEWPEWVAAIPRPLPAGTR